jgi:hypothetical protein
MRSEVEGYTDRQSYQVGDLMILHCSSRHSLVDIVIRRVAPVPETVHAARDVPCALQPIPDDAAEHGCRWAATLSLEVPGTWRSGYYEVTMTPAGSPGSPAFPAYFVVRSHGPGGSPILLVLATNTYNAYNDWGGSNLYTGSTSVSFKRPMAAGFLRRPAHLSLRTALPGAYDPEFRHLSSTLYDNRLSGWSAAAGWLNWEGPFAAWAESNGFDLDFAVNADLVFHPEVLKGRRLVLSVGHDEYWSWAMRDSLETFIANGGNVAFFSGNTCLWQIRFAPDAASFVCYKQDAHLEDPVLTGGNPRLMSGLWSDRVVGRPENELTGVSFTRGGYTRAGYGVPRASGGYTVWRPEHWVFDSTGLRYGDQLGVADAIVSYEADGCELATGPDGLPCPTHVDGTPATFMVLATAPARLWSNAPGRTDFSAAIHLPPGEAGDLEFVQQRLMTVGTAPAADDRLAHGNTVLGLYTQGGTVFTVGCTDWAHGLVGRDPMVERITHNVLTRLGTEPPHF